MIEFSRIKNTKFYASCAYYFVLENKLKNVKKARLLKNQDFVSKFEENLSEFVYYVDDLKNNLNEASKVKDALEVVFFQLNKIFKDHLPSLTLTKLSKNLIPEDLPLQ